MVNPFKIYTFVKFARFKVTMIFFKCGPSNAKKTQPVVWPKNKFDQNFFCGLLCPVEHISVPKNLDK